MKDQHHENSHPVDQYFLQQSELLEIKYNPKHWQQLSDQLRSQTIADSASDRAEDDIPKAASQKQSWLLLGILFLLSSTTLLWQLYSARSMEKIQRTEKTSIHYNNSNENSGNLVVQSAELEPAEHDTNFPDLHSKSSTTVNGPQQRRSTIIQPLRTSSLPLEVKSISTQTRPLVVPLDDKDGGKKEVFIFW